MLPVRAFGALRSGRFRTGATMPMFFYLPLIIARGVLSVGAEALEQSEAARLSRARLPVPQRRPLTAPRTKPGFDELWLGSQNPALR